jgi:hypothetical protein
MQLKRSELVRRALRQFLAEPSDLRARPDDRVRRLIGSLESGVPDLAVKHRSQIIDSLRRRD